MNKVFNLELRVQRIYRSLDVLFLDIAVNVPLDDALFAYTPPADFRPVLPSQDDKDEAGTQAPAGLDIFPTSCGAGFNTKICAWHAFRITERTALVVWQRSEPESAADGSRDWLSKLKITLDDERRAVPRHNWIYQSSEAEKWNWSLVTTDDGPLGDPGFILMKLFGPRFEGTMNLLPLRFSDADLERLLAAAGEAMLPADAEPHSLEALRKIARDQEAAPPAR